MVVIFCVSRFSVFISHQLPDDWWANGKMVRGTECSLGYLIFFITLEGNAFFFDRKNVEHLLLNIYPKYYRKVEEFLNPSKHTSSA